jgi:WD40 repeat protein
VKAHSGPVNSVAVFPNGRQIVTAAKDRRVLIWDTASAELVAQLWGHERGVLSVAISPDGSTLASCGIEGDVRIWRTLDPP